MMDILMIWNRQGMGKVEKKRKGKGKG